MSRRPAGRAQRLGVFGGTFDPPHHGHLALAEWARAELGLERVLFVPAGDPPHKRRAGLSSVAHRVAMTRLAVRGNPAFEVSTIDHRFFRSHKCFFRVVIPETVGTRFERCERLYIGLLLRSVAAA